MPRLADIANKDTVREYAQGLAQTSLQPVADLIAPTVSVSMPVGYYKVYTEKSRFRVPNTRRVIGARAVEIGWEATDAQYNCAAHALDYPVDIQEEDATLERMLLEGAQICAQTATLSHERDVLTMAAAALGGGADTLWNAGAQPIVTIDNAVRQVLQNAAYGSAMGVGIVFGCGAWTTFKNHPNVVNRFVVGNVGKASRTATPSEDMVGDLFLAGPEIRVSYAVIDTAPEGLPANLQFLVDNDVLVFARLQNPTTRDPSFMKTFRLMGRWMVPGSYSRDDGRVEVAKFDWSEDVKVTNASAAVRLTVRTA